MNTKSSSSKAQGPDGPGVFFNRELSWLGFARRVLALAENAELPLLERVKFAGIMGMLHDEFFMKRMSGLKRQIKRGSRKVSLDGRRPAEEFAACREELAKQVEHLGRVVNDQLRPALDAEGIPVRDVSDLKSSQRKALRKYFKEYVEPILTPLAVDAEHPFPFISNSGLNLAVLVPWEDAKRDRFVRIKVPSNRPRWVPLDGGGFVPLEQVIAANLDLMFPATPPRKAYLFRVTRGADGEPDDGGEGMAEEDPGSPGSLIRQVSKELKARRFAGVVRLEVDARMPNKLVRWLGQQLEVDREDTYAVDTFLRMSDLGDLDAPDRPELHYPPHRPVTHPRLRGLDPADPAAIFAEIARKDILLHHPYHGFDSSVLRFLESAAVDPGVLAIKLTIYRTSSDSPIVRALIEAARRGKQVAVLVEITARFDEAPNIAWGDLLEKEGVHVSYGVERLKTHVKLALVVRDEPGGLRRYVHAGTGNYHSKTARIYEDLGLLTADPEICDDVTAVFNSLTGATSHPRYATMLVAPVNMRNRFVEMIRREADHARAGKPAGIRAKMNQLQDPDVIRELYAAARAGVPVNLNVRGLCCLLPGVPGLSESIRVYGAVGRFLEHSRIYEFTNAGRAEYYIGSADWMKRNLSSRVETIIPVRDPEARRALAEILDVYDRDNCSVWDGDAEGNYTLRRPAPGDPCRAAQDLLIEKVSTARHPAGTAGAERQP